MQPVMIWSFTYEFDLDEYGKIPKNPSESGSILRKDRGTQERDNKISIDMDCYYFLI